MAEKLLQIVDPKETPLPHGKANDKAKIGAIGLDLGTTNSVIATYREGDIQVLRDDQGRALVPSIVAYAQDGSPIVGEAARLLLDTHPDRVIGSIKRLMGRGVEDIKKLSGVFPFDVEPGDGMVRLNIAGKILTPVEISADILKELKRSTEEDLGIEVDQAVITVPAYFDDAARTATKDAARLAGLEVLRLVNEPTAAALAYGLDEDVEGIYAVYDLGGGTFDISLLKMEKGVFQVLATGGDAALGGDDFDHAIADCFLRERRRLTGEETLSTGQVKKVLSLARQVKEWLSAHQEGEWTLVMNEASSTHRMTREHFEKLINKQVQRTITLCEGVLNDVDLAPDDVRGIIMVGGSSRVPVVREQVSALFPGKMLSHINPDEVVAIGAALQAKALTVGSDTLLLDVIPLSLGIETMGNMVEKIIHRNTPIPTAKAQEFTTYKDGQTAMSIRVVQGEREMVDQCRSLAHFDLRGIPPLVAGAARIQVTFSVDADGILTVSAREKTTGTEQSIMVKPSYGLSEEEMSAMIYDSMVHGQEDMHQRLLAEARLEAERSLEAVVSALEADGNMLEDRERQFIEKTMDKLKFALNKKDRDVINTLREELEKVTQGFAEKRMDQGIRAALRGVSVEELDGKKLS